MYRMKASSDLEHWVVFFQSVAPPLTKYRPSSPHMRVLAVDGGLRWAREWGYEVDMYLGDGDSYNGDLPVDHQVFPREKDYLDGEAALQFLLEHEVSRIDLINFFQGRWDMSFTHFQALSRFRNLANRVHIYTDHSEILFRDSKIEIYGKPGQKFSLVPLEPMNGVTLKGARYELDCQDVRPGRGLTISNEYATESISLKFKDNPLYLLEIYGLEFL